MGNTITANFNTFTPGTKIKSAEVDQNFSTLIDMSPIYNKYSISFAAFQALGATVTGYVVLNSLAANEVVGNRIIKHSTHITGTSITAAKVRIGKIGVDDYYSDDFDVFQAVGNAAAQKTGGCDCEFSTTSLILTMSLSGGLLSQLSTGALDVYVQKSTLP